MSMKAIEAAIEYAVKNDSNGEDECYDPQVLGIIAVDAMGDMYFIRSGPNNEALSFYIKIPGFDREVNNEITLDAALDTIRDLAERILRQQTMTDEDSDQ